MKLTLALISAAMAAKDADFTHDSTNNNVVRNPSAATSCLKCSVTGANTAATYQACDDNKSLEVCDTEHFQDYECFQRVTMNRSGNVIALETGCKQANACRTAERQNYVGGIALRNQCKPDPSIFGPRFNRQSVCNTCMPLCTAENVDCFSARDITGSDGYISGIYDGTSYRGAVGDHVNYVNNAGSPAITNTPAFWQPGHFINLSNTGRK